MCPTSAERTIAPPINVEGEAVSPKASQTQNGVSGTSKDAINVASAAGTRLDPKV
jgi:hypothetical protein